MSKASVLHGVTACIYATTLISYKCEFIVPAIVWQA